MLIALMCGVTAISYRSGTTSFGRRPGMLSKENAGSGAGGTAALVAAAVSAVAAGALSGYIHAIAAAVTSAPTPYLAISRPPKMSLPAMLLQRGVRARVGKSRLQLKCRHEPDRHRPDRVALLHRVHRRVLDDVLPVEQVLGVEAQ